MHPHFPDSNVISDKSQGFVEIRQVRKGVRAALDPCALTEIKRGEHGITRIAIYVCDMQQAHSREQPGCGGRPGMRLDDEGVSK